MMGHEELNRANILVFANKQDVNGCMSAAEISKQLNLQSMRKHKWQIQACCALSGEGLYQGLEWIVNNIKKRWWLMESLARPKKQLQAHGIIELFWMSSYHCYKYIQIKFYNIFVIPIITSHMANKPQSEITKCVA